MHATDSLEQKIQDRLLTSSILIYVRVIWCIYECLGCASWKLFVVPQLSFLATLLRRVIGATITKMKNSMEEKLTPNSICTRQVIHTKGAKLSLNIAS